MNAPAAKPLRAAWHEAPARIAALCAGRPCAVVAVSGPVGAGKSTLAARLSGCVLATDDYLPDYALVPEHERDEPRHLDWARLRANLLALRRGEPARVPVWSFQSHRREDERTVHPPGPAGPALPGTIPLIVVEGIHALCDTLADAVDLRVFVHAPAPERLARWCAMEERGERGWGADRASAFFHAVAEPTFTRRAAEYLASADVLVENSAAPPAQRTG